MIFICRLFWYIEPIIIWLMEKSISKSMSLNFISYMKKSDAYTMDLLKHIIEERRSGKEEFQKVEWFRGLSEVNEYFYDDSLNSGGDKTWIDVGAYTGDTIELAYDRFKDSIKKYYALEPNEKIVAELNNTINKLNIHDKTEILEYGLGNRDQILCFEEKGALSSINLAGGQKDKNKAMGSIGAGYHRHSLCKDGYRRSRDVSIGRHEKFYHRKKAVSGNLFIPQNRGYLRSASLYLQS